MIFIVGAKVVNILFQSIFALIRERKKSRTHHLLSPRPFR
ncbi:hypothetical protein HMPREF3185_00164 [Porphyromonas somerae]|uniref:Uncharacterized protein n=1 Tax=Porphyromonas somerae TaxID=322095 RepID=A0A134BEZ7_9PORP|nr:hypothetical protein HMPREF3184_00164 [Porphyromonadaceae bacterium KA00676]KXB78515.1 hypothetical protein HMPREF3185_00164 [Porphyromonas somerae]